MQAILTVRLAISWNAFNAVSRRFSHTTQRWALYESEDLPCAVCSSVFTISKYVCSCFCVNVDVHIVFWMSCQKADKMLKPSDVRALLVEIEATHLQFRRAWRSCQFQPLDAASL